MAKKDSTPDITSTVMEQIKSGRVNMKPKIVLISISALWGIGLAAATIISVFLINLLAFRLRTGRAFNHLAGPRPRIGTFMTVFPWGWLLLALIALALAIYLAKKYDFSYRHSHYSFLVFFAIFTLALGFFLAQTDFNSRLQRRGGPLRRLYEDPRPAPGPEHPGPMRRY